MFYFMIFLYTNWQFKLIRPQNIFQFWTFFDIHVSNIVGELFLFASVQVKLLGYCHQSSIGEVFSLCQRHMDEEVMSFQIMDEMENES